MVLSLVPLVLIVLAVVGFAGMCSFRPGSPGVDPGAAPRIDATQRLEELAGSVDFPVRVPELPSGWVANAAGVDPVGRVPGAPVAVRVGWLTPARDYLRLSQSPAAEPALASFETRLREAPTGAVEVAGRTWVRYPGPRSEQAWVTDLGDVRLLVTGSAGEEEFRTLARAVLAAPVAP